eukprot:733780-Pyramimonas_sp.AAC.1
MARIGFHGNPMVYATWTDESLNSILKTTAEHSHQLTFEARIFYTFSLVSELGLNKWICP